MSSCVYCGRQCLEPHLEYDAEPWECCPHCREIEENCKCHRCDKCYKVLITEDEHKDDVCQKCKKGGIK
jgi:hypothetical protein